MKIIQFKSDNTDLDDLMQRSSVVDGVNFLDDIQYKEVLEAFNTEDKLREVFDIIGIKYNNVKITEDRRIIYKVNDTILSLSSLSSGERYILYLMACKFHNKRIFAEGLLERLGSRLTKVVYEHLRDYDGLVLINYNRALPMEFRKYVIRSVEEIN